MKMLLLGGTAFLGRAIAVEALARGTSAPPEGVTFVRADRDEEALEYEERRDAPRRAGLSDSDELDLRGLLD